MLEQNISFFFEDIQAENIHKNRLEEHVISLIISEKYIVGDLSIIFCSDKYLLNMNKQYLKHDYYTDIITFDYTEQKVVSGDLFISYDRLKINAEEYKVNILKEVYRVVFHGVLHLVGYNDKTDEEQKEMTRKENQYLSEVDFSELVK